MQRNDSAPTNPQPLLPDRDQDPAVDYSAFYYNNQWPAANQQPLYYVAVPGMPEGYSGEAPAVLPYPQYPVYFVPPEFAQYQLSNPGLIPMAQDFVSPQTKHPALNSPRQVYNPEIARHTGERKVEKERKRQISEDHVDASKKRRTRNSSRIEPEITENESLKKHEDGTISDAEAEYKRSRTIATFASKDEIQGFKNLIKIVAAALALEEVDTSEELESGSAASVLLNLNNQPLDASDIASDIGFKTIEKAKHKYDRYYASLKRNCYSVNDSENLPSCIETSYVRGNSPVGEAAERTMPQRETTESDLTEILHYDSKEITHPTGTRRIKRSNELKTHLSQLEKLEKDNREKIVNHSFSVVEKKLGKLSRPLYSQSDLEGTDIQAFQDTLRDLVERQKVNSTGFEALKEYSANENLKAFHQTCLSLYGEMTDIVTGRLGVLKSLLLRQRELLEKPPQELGKEFYDVSSGKTGKVWRRFLNGSTEVSKLDELSSIVSDSEFLALTSTERNKEEGEGFKRGGTLTADSGSDTNAASGLDTAPSFTTRSGHSASRDWALNSIMKHYKAPSSLNNEEIEQDLTQLGRDLSKWKETK